MHSIRRGGASSSYQGGADYLDIQHQGDWQTSCFFDYVSIFNSTDSTVGPALNKVVNEAGRNQ